MIKRFFFYLIVISSLSCGKESADLIPPDNQIDKQMDDVTDMNDDAEEEESSSFTEGLLIIGDVKDPINGNFLLEPFQYEITSDFSPSSKSNLKSEVGILESDRPKYSASDEGMIFFNIERNVDSGSDGLFPYYKNFKNGVVNGYDEFTTIQGLKFYGDFKGDVYGVYYDLSTWAVGGSYEFFVKIIDSDNLSERKVSIGRYASSGYFKLQLSGDYLYLYYSEIAGVGDFASLDVIDLNLLEVIDSTNEAPNERFSLVKGDNGNCYFFSRKDNYIYDISSNTFVKQNVNNSIVVDSGFGSPIFVEPFVHDNLLYYASAGPQPGLQFFIPAIRDLTTGEVKFIQISEDFMQFEGDSSEWQPVYSALEYDFANKLIYLGVYSVGLATEDSSYGVLVVDYEGNIIEKTKTPIRPIKIIKQQ